MLTFGSALRNVARQDLWVLALVGAVGVSALEDLEVASTGAWLWVDAGQVVLEIWVLVEALEEIAKCSRLAIARDYGYRTSASRAVMGPVSGGLTEEQRLTPRYSLLAGYPQWSVHHLCRCFHRQRWQHHRKLAILEESNPAGYWSSGMRSGQPSSSHTVRKQQRRG